MSNIHPSVGPGEASSAPTDPTPQLKIVSVYSGDTVSIPLPSFTAFPQISEAGDSPSLLRNRRTVVDLSFRQVTTFLGGWVRPKDTLLVHADGYPICFNLKGQSSRRVSLQTTGQGERPTPSGASSVIHRDLHVMNPAISLQHHHHHHELTAPVCQECAAGGLIYALSQKHRLEAFRLPTSDLKLSRELSEKSRVSCQGDHPGPSESSVPSERTGPEIIRQLEAYRRRALDLLQTITQLRRIVERLLARQSHQFDGTAAVVKNAHHLFSALMDRYMDFRQRLEAFQKEADQQSEIYGDGWENVLARFPPHLVDKIKKRVLQTWTRSWESQVQRMETAGASLKKQFTALSRNIGVLTPPLNLTSPLEDIVPADLLDFSEHEHRLSDLREDEKCAKEALDSTAFPPPKSSAPKASGGATEIWGYLESRIQQHDSETWPDFLRDIESWQRGIEALFKQHSDQVAPQIQRSMSAAVQLRRQVQEFGNQISAYEAMLDEHEKNFHGLDLPALLQSAADVIEREMSRRQFFESHIQDNFRGYQRDLFRQLRGEQQNRIRFSDRNAQKLRLLEEWTVDLWPEGFLDTEISAQKILVHSRTRTSKELAQQSTTTEPPKPVKLNFTGSFNSNSQHRKQINDPNSLGSFVASLFTRRSSSAPTSAANTPVLEPRTLGSPEQLNEEEKSAPEPPELKIPEPAILSSDTQAREQEFLDEIAELRHKLDVERQHRSLRRLRTKLEEQNKTIHNLTSHVRALKQQCLELQDREDMWSEMAGRKVSLDSFQLHDLALFMRQDQPDLIGRLLQAEKPVYRALSSGRKLPNGIVPVLDPIHVWKLPDGRWPARILGVITRLTASSPPGSPVKSESPSSTDVAEEPSSAVNVERIDSLSQIEQFPSEMVARIQVIEIL